MKTKLANFPWATFGREESPKEFFGKLTEERSRTPLFPEKPLISIVLPVPKGTNREELARCLEALENQSYPHFEVIIVGPEATAVKDKDARFRLLPSENAETSQLLANGSHCAKGDWIGFLNAQDVLSPAAFYHYMRCAIGEARPDLLYPHEATLETSGGISKVRHFISKPAFSWFTLLHWDYVGRGYLVRRHLFEKAGGILALEKEAAPWSLLLRLSELTHAWENIPMYLYYREGEVEQTASLCDETSTTLLRNHLERAGIEASIVVNEGKREIIPHLAAQPLVTVVVCYKNHSDWTIRCLENLSQQTGVRLEVLLVNNRSEVAEAERVQKFASSYSWPTKVIEYEAPFNFAHMHNTSIRQHAKGDYLLLLNNDVFLGNPKTLRTMVSWAQFDWVGTAGMCLRFDHGGVQHAGFGVRFGGLARMARIGNAQSSDCFSFKNHEVFGNTFAACVMKRSTFLGVGGLRELEMSNGFGDVAFNFECLKRGLKNLYFGELEATHLESASRGISYEYWEEVFLEGQYPELLQRMLRQDLAIDRVPGKDHTLAPFLKEYLAMRLRAKFPWLKQVRQWTRFKKDSKRAIKAGPGELLPQP